MVNFQDNKQFGQWQQAWSQFQNQASPLKLSVLFSMYLIH
jgi:hypothetical protein